MGRKKGKKTLADRLKIDLDELDDNFESAVKLVLAGDGAGIQLDLPSGEMEVGDDAYPGIDAMFTKKELNYLLIEHIAKLAEFYQEMYPDDDDEDEDD